MINLQDVKLRQLEPNTELDATQFNIISVKRWIGYPGGQPHYEKLKKDMMRELMAKVGELATSDERAYSYQFLWNETPNHKTQYESATDIELRLIRVLVDWREAKVGEIVHGASLADSPAQVVQRYRPASRIPLFNQDPLTRRPRDILPAAFTFENIATDNGSYWKRTA